MGRRHASHTTTTKIIGRVGALAVTLGVGTGMGAASLVAPAVAHAESDVEKIIKKATPNISVSVGGVGFSSGTVRAAV